MMTAGRDYGVRVIQAYGMLSVGQVIFPTGCEREMLISQRRVEPVRPQPEASPCAARKASGKR